jgi:hypothetical protein
MLLKETRDLDYRAKQAEDLCARWREAVHRLWIDGGPAVPRLVEGDAVASKKG